MKLKLSPRSSALCSNISAVYATFMAQVFRRHQAGVVAKHLELATEMMRADTGLHTDQARRQVGEPRFHLAA
jgi:hypothetical protein